MSNFGQKNFSLQGEIPVMGKKLPNQQCIRLKTKLTLPQKQCQSVA